MILLDKRVARLCENFDQRVFVQRVKRNDYRQSPDEFRYQPEIYQVVGDNVLERLADILIVFGRDFRAESELTAAHPIFDDFVKIVERAAAYEQNIFRVNRDGLRRHLRVSTGHLHIDARTFQNLEQCLLNAFARNVAVHAGLAGDFVDLVNVNYTTFRTVNVTVRRTNQRK